MITIIHGDDISASRNFFLEQKIKASNLSSFEGEKLSITDIKQVFEGGGLFSDAKNIFIENFLSKPASEIIEYLGKQKEGNIVIWEEKELTKKQLSVLPKAEVKLFKIPAEIFAFLDSIQPSRGSDLIKRFHSIIGQKETEFVLFMLVRQFRLLLSLVDNSSKDEIDEVKRLAPWQKSKLLRQAGYFSTDKLVELYKKLFNIDYGLKTGSSSLSLTQSIDFFLLSI